MKMSKKTQMQCAEPNLVTNKPKAVSLMHKIMYINIYLTFFIKYIYVKTIIKTPYIYIICIIQV